MSEEVQAMGTVINVAFEGYSMAFKVMGTLGAKTAQALAKAIMCMFKSGSKAIKNHKLKKLQNQVGEVDLETLWKKDGTNLEYFAIKDSEYAQFLKMCEKEGICFNKLTDLNPGDGLTYIQVGANNVRAIQFNIDVLTKSALEKGKLQEGESIGHQCTIEDWIKSAPGKTDEERMNNFIEMSDKMYQKQLAEEKRRGELPSKNILQLEAKDRNAIIASVKKSEGKVYKPELFESFRVSKSAIIDENEKTIKIQCSKDEYMIVNKELIGNVTDKEFTINAPKDVKTSHGISMINVNNKHADMILNAAGVKKALDGRAADIKKRTADVVSRMRAHRRTVTPPAKKISAPKVVKA